MFLRRRKKIARSRRGFTFVEACLAMMVLGFAAVTIPRVYYSGLRSMEERKFRLQVDSIMRAKMEKLLGTRYEWRYKDSAFVMIDGVQYELEWDILDIDLDGDSKKEKDVQEIKVSLAGTEMYTVVTDPEGRITKIP